MSQKQQTASAQQAQNLNQTSIITYFKCDDGTICIVSIVSPNGQRFWKWDWNNCSDEPYYQKGDTQTPPANQKQYMIVSDNGKLNVLLDGKQINIFDENFGLHDGILRLENVSFRQFVYDQTAVDERTETFRKYSDNLSLRTRTGFVLKTTRNRRPLTLEK